MLHGSNLIQEGSGHAYDTPQLIPIGNLNTHLKLGHFSSFVPLTDIICN